MVQWIKHLLCKGEAGGYIPRAYTQAGKVWRQWVIPMLRAGQNPGASSRSKLARSTGDLGSVRDAASVSKVERLEEDTGISLWLHTQTHKHTNHM